MKQVSEVKVKIGLIKGENKVKLVMAKNEEVGRQLDLMTKNSEGKSRALEELVEEIDTLLREVHEPPSLVDLAAGRGAEEGLGLGEIPTTLKLEGGEAAGREAGASCEGTDQYPLHKNPHPNCCCGCVKGGAGHGGRANPDSPAGQAGLARRYRDGVE